MPNYLSLIFFLQNSSITFHLKSPTDKIIFSLSNLSILPPERNTLPELVKHFCIGNLKKVSKFNSFEIRSAFKITSLLHDLGEKPAVPTFSILFGSSIYSLRKATI